jgi:hypothetical protein
MASAVYTMTCDLLGFPSAFKAGLDLLPVNFKLGLQNKYDEGMRNYFKTGKHELFYDYQRAEDKGIDVVRHYCINNPAPIEVREFCLGFTQCLSGGTISIT